MITVTGATGNIGRGLSDLLRAAGEEITAVSRRPSPEGLPDGVRWAQADLGDPGSLRPALEQAHALFLLFSGEIGVREEIASAVVDLAVAAGVERIVLVSSQVSATRPDAPSHAGLRKAEEVVRDSGLDYTILRPAGFASNAFAWAESVRADRTVFAPFGDVALPVVDPADIAAVAAAALREDAHAGRIYELTGPELISPRQQAAALGEALGEQVRFVELAPREAHARMARFMPEQVVEGTLDVLGTPLPTEQRVGSDVTAVLGRPARSFGEWAALNAPAFK